VNFRIFEDEVLEEGVIQKLLAGHAPARIFVDALLKTN
jgi:hypothetical protein